MSWNPFSRHSVPKKSVVSKASEREFEREVKKLDELDESTRKIYKDGKRYIEANNALAKAEHKIVQDLENSVLCQNEEEFHRNIEGWERALEGVDRHRNEHNSNTQKTLVEPMKKLSSVFPSVQAAVKKRDQSLQEYNRCQARADKYQDRDRTGQNVVKLDATKKALESAKEEFNSQDQALKEDLPKLYDGRIDYFQPSFEALVRSQVTYSSEAFKVYSEVSSDFFDHSKLSEQERRARIQQTLADIKALSITADD